MSRATCTCAQIDSRHCRVHQTDIATDPAEQAMLKRLGEAVGSINAKGISRAKYVVKVAETIRARRGVLRPRQEIPDA